MKFDPGSPSFFDPCFLSFFGRIFKHFSSFLVFVIFINIAESYIFYSVFCISRLCCDPWPLHLFLQKMTLFFIDFRYLFSSKIDEKVVPGARPQKNRLLARFFSIFRFWVPLGGPWGSPGRLFSVKRGGTF